MGDVLKSNTHSGKSKEPSLYYTDDENAWVLGENYFQYKKGRAKLHIVRLVLL